MGPGSGYNGIWYDDACVFIPLLFLHSQSCQEEEEWYLHTLTRNEVKHMHDDEA